MDIRVRLDDNKKQQRIFSQPVRSTITNELGVAAGGSPVGADCGFGGITDGAELLETPGGWKGEGSGAAEVVEDDAEELSLADEDSFSHCSVCVHSSCCACAERAIADGFFSRQLSQYFPLEVDVSCRWE